MSRIEFYPYNSHSVLFYTGSLSSGGAERQLLYIALEAERNGYQVIIVIDQPQNDYDLMLKGSNIKIICTYASKRTPFKKFSRLLWIIHKEKPDIVHSFLATKNCWAMLCAYILKVPVRIASIRNCDKKSFYRHALIKSSFLEIIICSLQN